MGAGCKADMGAGRYVGPGQFPRYRVTAELTELMLGMPARERKAVIRYVEEHLMDGRPVVRLLTGPDRMCRSNTWYSRKLPRGRPGWSHRPEIKAAIAMYHRLALQDDLQQRREQLAQAARVLTRTAQKGALLLEEQVDDPDMEPMIRQRAAVAAMDRADVSTAVKAQHEITGTAEKYLEALLEARRGGDAGDGDEGGD